MSSRKEGNGINKSLKIGSKGRDVEKIQDYLTKFGYIRSKNAEKYYPPEPEPEYQIGVFDTVTSISVKMLQSFTNLPVTGEIDEKTISVMNSARCGVADILASSLVNGSWGKVEIRYSYRNFPHNSDEQQVRRSMNAAFVVWSDVTALRFTEVSLNDSPDIVIQFAEGDHGDGINFDGRGHVTAHAFFPPPSGGNLAGDIHFDEAENWRFDLPVQPNTIDFVSVAAHEIGHALGLSHSSFEDDLMYPFFGYGQQRKGLSQNDISRIRELYPWAYDPIYQGHGIGGFDLRSPVDQCQAIDFDSTGARDHLLFYRPGHGIAYLIRQRGGEFQPIIRSNDGLGGYDLRSGSDKLIPFDYDGIGVDNHIFLYRPGRGIAFIVKRKSDTFTSVFRSTNGLGGYDLRSELDNVVAFDYLGSGRRDHLLLFRPGTGIAFIVRRSGQDFDTIFVSAAGVGNYDLRSPNDQIIAFDYDSSGKSDHLLCYRPGHGVAHIVKRDGNTLRSIYTSNGSGIGGYDLRSPFDRAIAVSFADSGRKDHILLYRPGEGIAYIVRRAEDGFKAAYQSGAGIGGYDLRLRTDTVISCDLDASRRADDIAIFRSGEGTCWVLQRDP